MDQQNTDIKEIKKEYSIVVSTDNIISLYRFPNMLKDSFRMQIKDVCFKPVSKITELTTELPNKNISALKVKNLNTNNLKYKATPCPLESSYYTVIEGDKIVLYKIQNSYLFQPTHDHHAFEYQSNVIKKAENREEYEHRLKNINFKLKNIELEEFKRLEFIDSKSYPTFRIAQDDENISPNSKNTLFSTNKNLLVNNSSDKNLSVNGSNNKNILVNNSSDKNSLLNNSSAKNLLVNSSNDKNFLNNSNNQSSKILHDNEIEVRKIIKNFRICNLKDLQEIFSFNIKPVLEKMTDFISGRFVLKNAFYERSLHDSRNIILKMFSKSEEIEKREFDFLKDEIWMVEELCDSMGTRYKLKGFREEENLFTANYTEDIKRLFTNTRVMNIDNICSILQIDPEQAIFSLSDKNEFIHLSNNSYAINDKDYWLNNLFILLENKKSFELGELEQLLNDVEYDKDYLISEVKKYCSCKGNKYYIKK